MMRTILYSLTAFLLVGHAFLSYAGEPRNKINEIYLDESRCLVAPEIRGKKDNSISCFCRDAIIDARYLHQNYLRTGKDKNLNGAYLGLVDHATRICGEKYDVYNATQAEGWQWEGPQVKREYPPNAEILKTKPDGKGFRTIEYKVYLTYFDKGGHVVKAEDFMAVEKLPENFIR